MLSANFRAEVSEFVEEDLSETEERMFEWEEKVPGAERLDMRGPHKARFIPSLLVKTTSRKKCFLLGSLWAERTYRSFSQRDSSVSPQKVKMPHILKSICREII